MTCVDKIPYLEYFVNQSQLQPQVHQLPWNMKNNFFGSSEIRVFTHACTVAALSPVIRPAVPGDKEISRSAVSSNFDDFPCGNTFWDHSR